MLTFPLKLPYGGTLPNQAALDKYIVVQKLRSEGNGYAARVAKYHLEQIKTVSN